MRGVVFLYPPKTLSRQVVGGCSSGHRRVSLTAAATSPARPTLQDSGRPRRVLSFIGGIDLCDGRFDTHDHPLFRTLQLEHKRDFYQDCLPGVDGEAGGVRLHSLSAIPPVGGAVVGGLTSVSRLGLPPFK